MGGGNKERKTWRRQGEGKRGGKGEGGRNGGMKGGGQEGRVV